MNSELAKSLIHSYGHFRNQTVIGIDAVGADFKIFYASGSYHMGAIAANLLSNFILTEISADRNNAFEVNTYNHPVLPNQVLSEIFNCKCYHLRTLKKLRIVTFTSTCRKLILAHWTTFASPFFHF